MARVSFLVPTLASFVFAGWFLVQGMQTPGISIAMALMVAPPILTLFGLSKVSSAGISSDGKNAAAAAFGGAGLAVGYIAMFFVSWLIVAIVWFALHIPLLIVAVSLPTSDK